MRTGPTGGVETQVSGKSPGRVAAGKRLHELGIAGLGGRKPTHGWRATDAGEPLIIRRQWDARLAHTLVWVLYARGEFKKR